MVGTAVWKCPALCGCAIRMTATWVDESLPIENGEPTSYRHPAPRSMVTIDGLPFTGQPWTWRNPISSLEIVNVCAQHASLQTDPFPPDPYYGSPGYLRPIPENPTPAERLYIHLFKYAGQRATPITCTCSYYEHRDRSGVEPSDVKWHARHSKKCPLHQTDDDKHTRAREENARQGRTLAQAVSLLGIDPADTTPAVAARFRKLTGAWSYVVVGDTRVLHVDLTSVGASQPQKNTAQNWCDTNLGVGTVVID